MNLSVEFELSRIRNLIICSTSNVEIMYYDKPELTLESYLLKESNS